MTTTAPDDDFDNALAVFSHDIRALLPEGARQLLTDRIRSVHADWPNLGFADAADMARASLKGRYPHAQKRLDDLARIRQEAEWGVAGTAAELAFYNRIEPVLPELERLERLHPGQAGVRDLLEAAGKTLQEVGLSEEDATLLDQMMAEEQRALSGVRACGHEASGEGCDLGCDAL